MIFLNFFFPFLSVHSTHFHISSSNQTLTCLYLLHFIFLSLSNLFHPLLLIVSFFPVLSLFPSSTFSLFHSLLLFLPPFHCFTFSPTLSLLPPSSSPPFLCFTLLTSHSFFAFLLLPLSLLSSHDVLSTILNYIPTCSFLCCFYHVPYRVYFLLRFLFLLISVYFIYLLVTVSWIFVRVPT